METSLKHFILKDSGLHYVKDMPTDELDDNEHITSHIARNQYIEKLIASAIPVSNSREVELEIISEICEDLVIDEIYPLECQVEIQSNCECPESLMIGCQKMDSVEKCKTTYLAFVKLKEETKEPCPNCRETFEECACMRNICRKCSNPVGNITFSVCDDCWDEKHGKQDAVTKEGEIHIDYLEKIIFEQVKKFDINYQAFITCEVANALKSNFIITKRQ